MLGVRWGLRWRELSEGVVLMFKFVYERSVVSMSFLCDVLMAPNVLVVIVLEFVSFGCSWFACA